MQKWLFHPLTIIACTIFALFFYWSLTRTDQNIRISTETLHVLDQEVKQMASEVSQTEKQLQVATSAATQEKIIRDELLMQKPGEYVVQLPPSEKEQRPREKIIKTPWEGWRAVLGF